MPIREQGHWFLMVINLEDEAVYHLDSYVGHMDILKRKETIRIVVLILFLMFQFTLLLVFNLIFNVVYHLHARLLSSRILLQLAHTQGT